MFNTACHLRQEHQSHQISYLSIWFLSSATVQQYLFQSTVILLLKSQQGDCITQLTSPVLSLLSELPWYLPVRQQTRCMAWLPVAPPGWHPCQVQQRCGLGFASFLGSCLSEPERSLDWLPSLLGVCPGSPADRMIVDKNLVLGWFVS